MWETKPKTTPPKDWNRSRGLKSCKLDDDDDYDDDYDDDDNDDDDKLA
jgi:hypothetical protein